MNPVIHRFLSSPLLLWIVLALPSLQYLSEFLWPDRYYPEMMERSGVLSVQLLAFTLAITPITIIARRWIQTKRLALWLLKSRRYFGLAGFGYAFIHTALYVRQIFDFELIWLEAFQWSFGTGWIAFFILLPIAISSNAWGVRKLGSRWKQLQRLSYIAIIAAFIHWLLLDFFWDNALQYAIPLALAKLVQVAFNMLIKTKHTPMNA